MSTTNGNMKSFKVTDKDGNVYVMIPVDTEARQAIDEGKFMDFDPDYFTSEVSQDNTTVNVGLNGVPLGIDSDSPLKLVQDNAQGIVFGSDAPFSTAIAPEYSASSTYAVGDHCMYLGKYYECNTAISTAEAWNSGHWTETDVNSLLRQVEVFQVTYDTDHYTWPSYSSINSVVQKKKSVCLVQTNPAGAKFIYWLMFKPTSSANMYFRFANGSGNYVDIMSNDTVVEGSLTPKVESIAPEYDATATYPTVGTAVMHDGLRYVSNTAITTAEDWDSSHWTQQDVETALASAGGDSPIFIGTDSTLFDDALGAWDAGKTVMIRHGDIWYTIQQYVNGGTNYRNFYLSACVPEAYDTSNRNIKLTCIRWSRNSGLNKGGNLSYGANQLADLVLPSFNSDSDTSSKIIERYNVQGSGTHRIRWTNLDSIAVPSTTSHYNQNLRSGLNGTFQWEPDLNAGANKTESDISSGVYSVTDQHSVNVLVLTTVSTLTVKYTGTGAPNFALEIDNTGNSSAVTVTVKDASDNTLFYSTAAGNSIAAGKYVQLTCVNKCWTMAEFT